MQSDGLLHNIFYGSRRRVLSLFGGFYALRKWLNYRASKAKTEVKTISPD
jgi:hypothetical protein